MKNVGIILKRILVVEDEPGISQVCLRVLEADGYEVDIAVNGDVAQEMLEKNEYDLCLIDVRTPVMNGEQLYRVIETKYTGLVKGVVFTTGDVMDQCTQNFLSSSGRLFLPKPFYPEELRATIGEALRHLE